VAIVELKEKKGKITFFPKPKFKKVVSQLNFADFSAIRISLASPEQIRSWSYGEVKKTDTINYRNFRPERDGLFCERIFGPLRDWECNCGKYKYIKHKGIICDRCGVEVTESKVRRERMGHIELAAPVAHIWFLRKTPSRIATLLGMRITDVEKIIYYTRYIILEDLKDNQGKTILAKKQILNEEEYQKYKQEYGQKFKVDTGAGAIRQLLSELDLKKESEELRKKIQTSQSDSERNRLLTHLRVVEGFIQSGCRPEWMILTVLPVIPPDLRPLVPLEGGRFATSDLNDLYRRIVNRNNRLKHIIQLKAPEVMIHNEKRLLQEAVDVLFENGARGKVVTGAGNRPLKSLSDVIKGKQGRFRQNLLGKRVDYSGRSVIVVGPNLKLHQCGLPKEIALELFKPFIIRELMHQHNVTLRTAKRMLERAKPEVWDILETVTKNHPVLLNRAPTLHRLSIQAFEPVLVEGKAIQLHPLTCAAFNADFDGDQMAVHLPLSQEAQLEARLLMLAPNNILSPASGRPIAAPSQDMVLGCAYLTREKIGNLGEGKIFSSTDEVISAYQNKEIDLNARIKVRGINNKLNEGKNPQEWTDYTTVGRIIFNQVIPQELSYINQSVDKKNLANLVEKCYHRLGGYRTALLLDDLKKLGYHYANLTGLTISISQMHIPSVKEEFIQKALAQVKEIERLAKNGLITETERYNRIIDIWTHITERITEIMLKEMSKYDEIPTPPEEEKFNPLLLMVNSGARGSLEQIRQLCGIRGLMARPQRKIVGEVGEIIESPVLSNFREGLTVLEYFISTHGGRKGLADTALKTADAGYLTRRLVDVTHDTVVTMEDCGTFNGVRIGALRSGDEIIEPLEERVIGRIALDNVVGLLPDGKGEFHEEVIVKAGEVITPEQARKIEQAGIERMRIRSVLTCEASFGVCAKCYGLNLATGRLVDVGEAVGIIAAQSIGEPGTQLTLRTFHIGGTAARVVKKSQAQAGRAGIVKYHNIRTIKTKEKQLINISRNAVISIRELTGKQIKEHHEIPYSAKLYVKDGQKISAGELLAEWDPYVLPILSEAEGTVKLLDVIEGITLQEEKNRVTGLVERKIIEHRVDRLHPQVVVLNRKGEKIASYSLPVDAHLVVSSNNKVEVGTVLAKIPQEVSRSKDITGGLPRVAELFEARRPKNAAIISEIDGIVKIAPAPKGIPKVIVTNEETGFSREYLIPQGEHLVVYEGDRVGVGEPLTAGAINPHDILRVKGAKEMQEHLVNEVQEVYRLQGVNINDKHIEIIVRQMVPHVKITKRGDTKFLVGEIVKKTKFEEENQLMKKLGKKQAEAYPVLLGITKASLLSESFISAASFQETSRVLTEAAIKGGIDRLNGLKENVIIGHLIPAGTGFREYQKI